MKHFFVGILALSTLIFASCNSNQEDSQTAPESTTQVASSDNKAAGNFSELYNQYQHLSSALSSDNDQKAAEAANSLLTALTNVQTESLSDSQKAEYQTLSADMKQHTEGIAANAGNIAKQREHFESVSKDVYDVAKKFGTDKPLYKVYCPMVDNDRGAYWLSEKKEVLNPYFGAGMLTCGEVQEEIN